MRFTTTLKSVFGELSLGSGVKIMFSVMYVCVRCVCVCVCVCLFLTESVDFLNKLRTISITFCGRRACEKWIHKPITATIARGREATHAE